MTSTDKPSAEVKADFAVAEEGSKEARLQKWQTENREAFAAYDKRIEKRGVFSVGKRLF